MFGILKKTFAYLLHHEIGIKRYNYYTIYACKINSLMRVTCKIRGRFYESPYPRDKGGVTGEKRFPKRPRSEHGKPALVEIAPIIDEKAAPFTFNAISIPLRSVPAALISGLTHPRP